MQKIKPVILVVEDDSATAELLRFLLQSNEYKAIVAKDGKQALSLTASYCPDLILLDLGLPDMDGLSVLEQLRQWSAIPVIVVSACHQEEKIVAALDNGADDYITKPFHNNELCARIRLSLRRNSKGAQNQTANVFSVGDLVIDYGRRKVVVRGHSLHLTPIEYRLLTLLSANAGRVLTHDFILCELWGPYIKDNRVLRVNIANIRHKIELDPANPLYIQTEIGVGYRMAENV